MISMFGAFDFMEGGRTYTCRIEEADSGPREAWWWFAVTGDRARYAPFRASVGDTQASVRTRVVAYYEDRITRRGGAWAPRDATLRAN